MRDLFSEQLDIFPGMVLLKAFVKTESLNADLQCVLTQSPLRRMQTSRGQYMSVRNTNCGEVGWVSDRQGYRYTDKDPLTGKRWAAMPEPMRALAISAATEAGFPDFLPDTCLINQYVPGTQMGAHRDADEQDMSQPIVSVSIGIMARFFVTGLGRRGKSTAVDLSDGDVLVFGGPARRYYHGVRKLKQSEHPHFGAVRWNLTFRKAQ